MLRPDRKGKPMSAREKTRLHSSTFCENALLKPLLLYHVHDKAMAKQKARSFQRDERNLELIIELQNALTFWYTVLQQTRKPINASKTE